MMAAPDERKQMDTPARLRHGFGQSGTASPERILGCRKSHSAHTVALANPDLIESKLFVAGSHRLRENGTGDRFFDSGDSAWLHAPLRPTDYRAVSLGSCLAEFEGRASLRTWLYRIATNRCLNALRSASPATRQGMGHSRNCPPDPTRLSEVVWLEPFPDTLLEGAIDVPLGPEARYERTESISLAFVTALQLLPHRQLAVLILRDVLGFQASEVACMLDWTVESVNSALKRARASLQRLRPLKADHEPPPAPDPAFEDALVAKFVSAYESADLDALVALLTDDVFISMPPMPLEYEGRDIVARFFALLFGGCGRRFELVRTRANGQPAFGAYLRTATGVRRGRASGQNFTQAAPRQLAKKAPLQELLPGLRKRSFWPVVVARREIIGVGTILR
jgi:RNA polymerase sigma-70 factor (TIGR02960 family)